MLLIARIKFIARRELIFLNFENVLEMYIKIQKQVLLFSHKTQQH